MKKSRKNVQIGLGAASILMIFVVLCMMILSVLAYNHGLQNLKIAKREVVFEEAYRKANTNATIVYEVLLQQLQHTSLDDVMNMESTQKVMDTYVQAYRVDGTIITLEVYVNKTQTLDIELEQQGNTLLRKQWKLSSSGGDI